MRVKHYIKNGLILLPLIFSGQFFESSLIIKNLLGIIAFGLVSSVVYIINVIRDVENDRNHPTKRDRPIASGAVSIRNAWILAVILLIISTAMNYFICGLNLWAWLFIALYLSLNLSYSLG